jgi:hypothetical protein
MSSAMSNSAGLKMMSIAAEKTTVKILPGFIIPHQNSGYFRNLVEGDKMKAAAVALAAPGASGYDADESITPKPASFNALAGIRTPFLPYLPLGNSIARSLPSLIHL